MSPVLNWGSILMEQVSKVEAGSENGSSGERGYNRVWTKRMEYSYALQEMVQTILRMRASGEDTGEAVEALGDAVIPIADKQFREEWDERPVAGWYDEEAEEWILVPTQQDARRAFRIIMELLGRRQILGKTSTTSWARM